MYTSDSELLEACLRKEPKAQATLYQRYKGRFFGICRRYAKNSHDAEDMFQDAVVKVFQKLHELKSVEQLSAWVRRIVVNVCIDHYHKQTNFVDINDYVEGFQQEWQSESIISELSNQELLSLINELPDGSRMIFNMYVIDGYPHHEIAKMLGISEGTSKSQLFFAKKLLKNKLQLMGVTV